MRNHSHPSSVVRSVMASPPYSRQRRSLRAGLPRSATGLIPEGTAAPVSGGVGFGATRPYRSTRATEQPAHPEDRSWIQTPVAVTAPVLFYKTAREGLKLPVRADAPRCLRRCIPSLLTPPILHSADSPAFPEEGELAPAEHVLKQYLAFCHLFQQLSCLFWRVQW